MPIEIGAGSFVCMKKGVTGTLCEHRLEPPNWVTTHVCIQSLPE